jgi:mono/diheme cytochrome c family protein
MRIPLIAIFALLPLAGHATDPWGKADLDAGKSLHEKSCTGCHIRMYGGDGSKMYTRDGRLLSSKLDILQRVSTCNAQVSAGWFPEDEGNVAAWLNKHYYRFDK